MSPAPVTNAIASQDGIDADYWLSVLDRRLRASIQMLKLRIAILMLSTLARLPHALKTEAFFSEKITNCALTHGMSGRGSSAANFVVLLLVQRNGDSGSPRVTGSTSRLSASLNPGSVSVIRLRPPPGRRLRPSTTDTADGVSHSSACPAWMVPRLIPVARDTMLTPP